VIEVSVTDCNGSKVSVLHNTQPQSSTKHIEESLFLIRSSSCPGPLLLAPRHTACDAPKEDNAIAEGDKEQYLIACPQNNSNTSIKTKDIKANK